MPPEQLKAKYLSLKKEVKEIRNFQSLQQIKKYWKLQIEKYQVYEAYKKALIKNVVARHKTDSNVQNET